MGVLRRALLASLLLGAGFGAAGASAATVTVTLDAEFHSFKQVRYVAAPGEINDLTAHYAADAESVTVSDPGAVIDARGSCTSLSAHSAVCRARRPGGTFLQSVRALLGDRNDRAVTTRTGPNVIGGIDAFGGPGDDVLTGSPAEDLLDGGGGTDVLTGGDGFDELSDGDRDGAGASVGPDADRLDGGRGRDTLSYGGRTRGVVVDLASDDPAGEPGEGDTARGFESVMGGKGDDRLSGDGGTNSLSGGGGSNLLVGRGGDDFLTEASGAVVRCGGGVDRVTKTRAGTRVPATCERLSVRLPRGANVDGGASLDPVPRRQDTALGLDVSCPQIDGFPTGCRATVRIVTRSSGRLLATGRLEQSSREDTSRFLRLRLTGLGGRLHRDRRRQSATVVIRGPLMARTAWTIGF